MYINLDSKQICIVRTQLVAEGAVGEIVAAGAVGLTERRHSFPGAALGRDLSSSMQRQIQIAPDVIVLPPARS